MRVALLTDFGTCDWFVASMKGVIAEIAPDVAVIDITHDVPAGDIRAGAFALRACCRDFPAGTVFCAVVDPGVGSSRAALAARAGEYIFVGPDNGLLFWALDFTDPSVIHRIDEPRHLRPHASATFHGRDLFAPVAARLASGISLDEVGPRVTEIVRLDWPQPRVSSDGVHGEVVYIDRFGNCITSIEGLLLRSGDHADVIVQAGAHVDIPLRRFYQQVNTGEPLSLIGSAGLLEVSVNGGSAAERLGVRIGDVVSVRAPGDPDAG